jgi:hypothetical protein
MSLKIQGYPLYNTKNVDIGFLVKLRLGTMFVAKNSIGWIFIESLISTRSNLSTLEVDLNETLISQALQMVAKPDPSLPDSGSVQNANYIEDKDSARTFVLDVLTFRLPRFQYIYKLPNKR